MTAHPPLPWLQFITLTSLMGGYGSVAIRNALGHGFDYVRAPEMQGSEIVATLHARAVGGTVSTIWRGRRTTGQLGWEVRIGMVVEGHDSARILASCNCNAWGMRCDHLYAVLVDLAVCTELLDAVVSGRPSAPILASLPALRAQTLEELHALALGAQWFALPPRNVDARFDLRVGIVDPRTALHRKSDTFPQLEVRLAHPVTRALFEPAAVLSDGLPPFERRLLTLGRPLSRGRKGVSMEGVSASVALHLLAGSGRAVLWGEKGSEPVQFSREPASLRLVRTTMARNAVSLSANAHARGARVERDGTVHALEGRWTCEPARLDVSAREAVLFSGPFPFLFVPATKTFHPVDPAVDLDVAWNLFNTPSAELPVRHAPSVFAGLQTALAGRAVSLPAPEEMGLAPRADATLQLRVSGAPLDVEARLEARYDFGIVALSPAGPLAPLRFEDDVRRDRTREEIAVARVQAAGLVWRDDLRAFAASHDAAVEFWQKGLPALRADSAAGVALLLAENLRNVAVRPPVKARVRVQLSNNLLDAHVHFDVGELAADIERVREALRQKRRWIALDDGTISELQESVAGFVDELAEVMPAKASRDGRVKLAAHQLGRVERWLDAGIDGELDPAIEGFRKRLKALAVEGDAALPKKLTASLRPYQVQGVAWLQFLDALGAGGVLADDMGLGKTLTTLTLLQHWKERDGAAPSLVVCPTSVASNWVREAARFTPDLRVHLYHGIDREKDPAPLRAADLVVTTYALLRRDIALLAGIHFRCAILDEAQHIKNAGAVTAQAARDLVADRRLALSGTPVENHLGELWSLFEFCNPGMLGTAKDFAARYETPISHDPRGPAAHRLRALVRPFLLRRTKRDVLHDLPPKQEIDQTVALTARQRRMYDALSAAVLSDVEKKIAEQGIARAGISILTALLRLRQMACDPRLVDDAALAASSAKREAFLDLVKSLAAEGRRALVFSQFVELLTLWREDLDTLGIAYEYLDGRTRDREAVVRRFQDGDAPLFLISLKAGGTGLNLTGADTVIHCDPWWNPAVEDQATDRAHRIGQTRAVTVYRLLAKGTVEEKIVALKGRKRELADAVVSGDAGALKGLSADDVRMLLGGADDESFEGDDEPVAATPASRRRAAKP